MHPKAPHHRLRHSLRVVATAAVAAGALLASSGVASAATTTHHHDRRHDLADLVAAPADHSDLVHVLKHDRSMKHRSGGGTSTRTSTTVTSSPKSTPAASAGGPMLGVLGVSGDYDSIEAEAGVRSVTIQVGWVLAEPAEGSFSTSYLDSVNTQIQNAVADGLEVMIDPGIQYAPSWVYGLGGGTQFVDQFGDVFTGAVGSGDDVANAVTDPAVRSALQAYLAELGQTLDTADITAVRQGGGPTGETRYPDADYDGHTNCYWAYDASSQALSPALDYTPGTGTTAEATAFLNQYNADLDGFAEWMNAQLATDFDKTILVMLPGWGQRPGVAAQEEADLLTIPYDEFNQGLDWTDLLPNLPDQTQSVAYTTYLDAPSYADNPQQESPALYIASLAGPLGMRLGGENTGNGTIASLQTTLETAKSLGYWIVNWMDESQLVASSEGIDPLGPSFTDLALVSRADFGV